MDLHDDVARSSTRGVNRMVPGATHFIQFDQPSAVIEAVFQVLDQIETEQRGSGNSSGQF